MAGDGFVGGPDERLRLGLELASDLGWALELDWRAPGDADVCE